MSWCVSHILILLLQLSAPGNGVELLVQPDTLLTPAGFQVTLKTKIPLTEVELRVIASEPRISVTPVATQKIASLKTGEERSFKFAASFPIGTSGKLAVEVKSKSGNRNLVNVAAVQIGPSPERQSVQQPGALNERLAKPPNK
ncbi:MAG: hypothetical protein HY646_04075 [Acidobacteria bacterium]|nr:hypothetical protein [Acidobacteriota bacterium]